MRFKSDAHRKAVFARLGSNSSPDYTLDTWQKEVAGVPKFKIAEYYSSIWPKLAPQFKDRNILVRYTHDGDRVVRRHKTGSGGYQTIDTKDDLLEIVRQHGVELWPETAEKGDLDRTDLVVLDIDNLGGIPEKDVKMVTKEVYKKMYNLTGSVGKPYILNTQGGYHVGVNLGKKIGFGRARSIVDREVIGPLEIEYPNLVSKKYDKTPIFLDKTPIKSHGSTRAEGSLNLPDLVISEKVSIEDIDSFRKRRLA